jgi:hypothetical protein
VPEKGPDKIVEFFSGNFFGSSVKSVYGLQFLQAFFDASLERRNAVLRRPVEGYLELLLLPTAGENEQGC